MSWHLFEFRMDLASSVGGPSWRPLHPPAEGPFQFKTPGAALDFARGSAVLGKRAANGGDGSLAVAPKGWDGSNAPEPGAGLVVEGVQP